MSNASPRESMLYSNQTYIHIIMHLRSSNTDGKQHQRFCTDLTLPVSRLWGQQAALRPYERCNVALSINSSFVLVRVMRNMNSTVGVIRVRMRSVSVSMVWSIHVYSHFSSQNLWYNLVFLAHTRRLLYSSHTTMFIQFSHNGWCSFTRKGIFWSCKSLLKAFHLRGCCTISFLVLLMLIHSAFNT